MRIYIFEEIKKKKKKINISYIICINDFIYKYLEKSDIIYNNF
jgi:hypothetical protein